MTTSRISPFSIGGPGFAFAAIAVILMMKRELVLLYPLWKSAERARKFRVVFAGVIGSAGAFAAVMFMTDPHVLAMATAGCFGLYLFSHPEIKKEFA